MSQGHCPTGHQSPAPVAVQPSNEGLLGSDLGLQQGTRGSSEPTSLLLFPELKAVMNLTAWACDLGEEKLVDSVVSGFGEGTVD